MKSFWRWWPAGAPKPLCRRCWPAGQHPPDVQASIEQRWRLRVKQSWQASGRFWRSAHNNYHYNHNYHHHNYHYNHNHNHHTDTEEDAKLGGEKEEEEKLGSSNSNTNSGNLSLGSCQGLATLKSSSCLHKDEQGWGLAHGNEEVEKVKLVDMGAYESDCTMQELLINSIGDAQCLYEPEPFEGSEKGSEDEAEEEDAAMATDEEERKVEEGDDDNDLQQGFTSFGASMSKHDGEEQQKKRER